MSSINGTVPVVPSANVSNQQARLNPNMAIIIVVLIGACLLVAIFSMYIRRCTQGIIVGEIRRNLSIHFYDRPGEGLERAVIDSLPMVSFSVVKTLKHGKEDLECTVCLESFEEDEALRLLPKCSHVFHTECIDAWFLSHSTCPLCRTSLKGTVAGGGGGGGGGGGEDGDDGVPAVGEVSRRILEAQEELLVSSARMGSDNGTVIGEDEVLDDGSGRDTDRESERNSRRLAMLRKLYQNSNSFRRAARGVQVRERLATLSARYPSAASSADHVQEAPQGCIHLSLQRTSSSDYNQYNQYGSSSMGRLGSLNERETPDENDQIVEEEGASSSWITLEDIEPPPKTSVSLGKPTDTRVLLGKPGSGKWEQRVRMERGSLRGLRRPFSRSASEGRAHVFEIEGLPLESGNATLAQRTMHWLSGGGNRHSRSGPLEGRNDLHQIVTE